MLWSCFDIQQCSYLNGLQHCFKLCLQCPILFLIFPELYSFMETLELLKVKSSHAVDIPEGRVCSTAVSCLTRLQAGSRSVTTSHQNSPPNTKCWPLPMYTLNCLGTPLQFHKNLYNLSPEMSTPHVSNPRTSIAGRQFVGMPLIASWPCTEQAG